MPPEQPISSDHRPGSHGEPVDHRVPNHQDDSSRQRGPIQQNKPAERVDIPAQWLAEFEAAARRPLKTRFRYAFIKTYKPVLDDEPFRAFATTVDYRHWPSRSF